MKLNSEKSNLIDKLILFFIFLFLGSLSISIFVNQLGYYGALILLLYKYYRNKENPFSKNGLEVILLLYIGAEILSTLFSVNHGQSFHNLLKRFFLLPMMYTVASAADDFKKAKLFLKVYLGCALASIALYLAFSARYYFYNLYQIEQSGPMVYQYPITTSELMSFTSIILFAFVIDAKNKTKYRLYSLAGFLISFIAMIATYKRTGWMGAAAGIITILIIKKKWPLLAVIVVAGFLLAVTSRGKSEIYTYLCDGKITELSNFKTEGRAYDMLTDKQDLWIGDYENGILKYESGVTKKIISTPSPVNKLLQINDSLLVANLIDTRFVLYKKQNDGGLKEVHEFASPGFTTSYCFYKDAFYVQDRDSGLTVFPHFMESTKSIRYSQFAGYENVFCDSAYIVMYSNTKGLCVYSALNGLPESSIVNNEFIDEISYIDYIDHTLLIENKKTLKLYKIGNAKLTEICENSKIKGVYQRDLSGANLSLLTNKGQLFKIQYPLNNEIKIVSSWRLDYLPQAFTCSGDTVYASKVKNNRFASIVDRYNPSNYTRFALWSAGMKMFKDHPVFGVGDIDLADLYRHYKHFYDKEIQGHMHNNYVHILVTLGLFGFVVVMLLLVKLLTLNYKIYKTLENEVFSSSYAVGVIGCLVSFLVAGLTEWNFGDHEVITMIWFLTGLNIAFYNLYIKQKNKTS